MMIDCPECGAQHYPGTLFCDTCGAAVHPAAVAHLAATRIAAEPKSPVRAASDGRTEPLRDPAGHTDEPIGNAAPAMTPPRALHIRLTHHQTELTLRAALIRVGRTDPSSDFVPELDLTQFGGQERGVSRRHATIRWAGNVYMISDNHSANGTWLEGKRLESGRAYPILSFANVRFGGLVVQLTIAD